MFEIIQLNFHLPFGGVGGIKYPVNSVRGTTDLWQPHVFCMLFPDTFLMRAQTPENLTQYMIVKPFFLPGTRDVLRQIEIKPKRKYPGGSAAPANPPANRDRNLFGKTMFSNGYSN